MEVESEVLGDVFNGQFFHFMIMGERVILPQIIEVKQIEKETSVKPSPRQEPPGTWWPSIYKCLFQLDDEPNLYIKNWLFGSSRSLLSMFFASLDKDKGGRLRADILSLCLAPQKGIMKYYSSLTLFTQNWYDFHPPA